MKKNPYRESIGAEEYVSPREVSELALPKLKQYSQMLSSYLDRAFTGDVSAQQMLREVYGGTWATLKRKLMTEDPVKWEHIFQKGIEKLMYVANPKRHKPVYLTTKSQEKIVRGIAIKYGWEVVEIMGNIQGTVDILVLPIVNRKQKSFSLMEREIRRRFKNINDIHRYGRNPKRRLTMGDVWEFKTPSEESAQEDLSELSQRALQGDKWAINYLRKIWDGESWESIKRKLETGGSVWYVWWMDGVRKRMQQYKSNPKRRLTTTITKPIIKGYGFYPAIIGIYDNQGRTFDRYTIVVNKKTNGYWMALGLSKNPDSPQGFSQWGEAVLGSHLGKRIAFSSLPENVRKHIVKRLK